MRAKFFLDLSPSGLEDGIEMEKLDTIINHAFEIVHFSTGKLDIIVLESIYYLLTSAQTLPNVSWVEAGAQEKVVKHGFLICKTVKSLDFPLSQVQVDPGKESYNKFSECYQLKLVTADIQIVKKINLYFHNSIKGIKSLEYRI